MIKIPAPEVLIFTEPKFGSNVSKLININFTIPDPIENFDFQENMDDDKFVEIDMDFIQTKKPFKISNKSEIEGDLKGIQLPNDYEKIKNNLHLISKDRKSKKGSGPQIYGINDLQQIARSIGLSTVGKKDELSARITSAVTSYFAQTTPQVKKTKKK